MYIFIERSVFYKSFKNAIIKKKSIDVSYMTSCPDVGMCNVLTTVSHNVITVLSDEHLRFSVISRTLSIPGEYKNRLLSHSEY